jgi:hypothetical protein
MWTFYKILLYIYIYKWAKRRGEKKQKEVRNVPMAQEEIRKQAYVKRMENQQLENKNIIKIYLNPLIWYLK